MKRIISLFVALVLLLSTLATVSFSEGKLIFSDNFNEGFASKNWINDSGCAFSWDKYNNCLEGFSDARVLQSNFLKKYGKMWDQFYGKFDVQFREFDDVEYNGNPHTFAIWYCDLFENDSDKGEPNGAVYMFYVEAETGKAYMTKEITYKYYDEYGVTRENSIHTVIAEGEVGHPLEVGEKAPWYEIGIRVTSGRIEGYVDRELILFAEAKEDDEKIGHISLNNVDSTVGSQRSPFIIFNGENGSASWMALDNFEIWSADYDFTSSVVYGDADGDGAVKLGDASLMLKQVAGWSDLTIDLAAADVNLDGNVNLTDVSAVLKVVAGWEDVVLPIA